MECGEYQKLLSRLLDGELDEEKAAAARDHMTSCSTCAEFYASAFSIGSALGASLDAAIPSNLSVRVKQAVAAERNKASTNILPARWIQVPLTAGLLIVAIGLGGLAGHSLSEALRPGLDAGELEALVPASDTSFAQALVEMASLEDRK